MQYSTNAIAPAITNLVLYLNRLDSHHIVELDKR
jgi:hypothetical protein